MTDFIRSRRSSPVVYFSPVLDELRLSPEAVRVYIHLLCWISREDVLFPSIEVIANHCFPSASPEKAKKTIGKAITELIDRNVLRCECTTYSSGDISKNCYYITDESEWKRDERDAA